MRFNTPAIARSSGFIPRTVDPSISKISSFVLKNICRITSFLKSLDKKKELEIHLHITSNRPYPVRELRESGLEVSTVFEIIINLLVIHLSQPSTLNLCLLDIEGD